MAASHEGEAMSAAVPGEEIKAAAEGGLVVLDAAGAALTLSCAEAKRLAEDLMAAAEAAERHADGEGRPGDWPE